MHHEDHVLANILRVIADALDGLPEWDYDEARDAITRSLLGGIDGRRDVGSLVQQALADSSVISDDVLDTITQMIAQIDKKISDQMNEILHAEEFQKLESSWRGLHYLVMNSETGTNLKIRLMNLPKREMIRDLPRPAAEAKKP